MQYEKDLAYKAFHDKLTGLYNRAGFDFLVKDIESENIAFMIIDIDDFKNINDNFGHAFGYPVN